MNRNLQTVQDNTMLAAKSRPLLYLRPTQICPQLPSQLGQHGWKVDVAADSDSALELMGQRDYPVGLIHWDAALTDVREMRQEAEELLGANTRANWIALISNASSAPDSMCSTISRYFYDYHTFPVDADRLMVTIGHAHGMAELAESGVENYVATSSAQEMVGRSRCMKKLFQQIGKVASIDFNVLVRGESGTGKELTAHAIHDLSERADRPFVAVNCGALPKDLIQAELFGHEKGSFTGAERRRIGRIEAAQGGTLFLDEIGDLPMDLQVNLLRFIQEKTIARIGGAGEIPVDVRIIAATNVNLEQAVKEGRFREDLYYRLNVLDVDIPPLRVRGADIELLANHFFNTFAKLANPNLKGFSDRAMDAIGTYTWPGNVREMVNRVQRAVVMCDGKLISVRDLGLEFEQKIVHLETLAEARAKAEKQAIESTLRAVRNNVSKASRHLGVSRVTLYRLMELHSIDWQTSTDSS